MSGNAGRGQILIALITVAGGIATALIANWDKLFPPAGPPAVLAGAPSPASPPINTTPAALVRPPQAAPDTIDLTGDWLDPVGGARYRFEQDGGHFRFVAVQAGFRSTGEGTIRGREFDGDYRTLQADGSQYAGHCRSVVVGDGAQTRIHADCQDAINGRYAVVLTR